MRITIVLTLLAVFYTVKAVPVSVFTDLDILWYEVRNMKWDVDTVIRRLILLRSEAEQDTTRQISLKWDKEMNNHREYKNLLLGSIRNEIDAAKAEGKDENDLNECYKTAENGVKSNEEVAYSDAKKCKDTARKNVHSNLGFIDNLISTGYVMDSELDNVFMNCYDSDVSIMQSCIIRELARIKSSLNTLQTDSITAEITIGPVSKNVIIQASNCIKQAYSILYTSGPVIKSGASYCIENAKCPTKPTTKSTTKPTTKPTTKSTTKPTTKPMIKSMESLIELSKELSVLE